jgi:hypothetical protein
MPFTNVLRFLKFAKANADEAVASNLQPIVGPTNVVHSNPLRTIE